MGGFRASLTTTWTAGSIGTWNFVAGTVRQVSATFSELCVKYNDDAAGCSFNFVVFAESGTMTLVLGRGFHGYIMRMCMFDFAKLDNYNLANMFDTGVNCNVFNGNTCPYCDAIN